MTPTPQTLMRAIYEAIETAAKQNDLQTVNSLSVIYDRMLDLKACEQ
jgi:hypothetical protein